MDRAFRLLQLIVASTTPIGVRELARRAALSPSTTSRTVGILVDLGMAERTPDASIRPGPSLRSLTRDAAHSPAALRDRFRPLAAEMADVFGENAAVAIDDGEGALYLLSARLDTAVQVADPAGETFPFHLTAPGIVLMSSWADARLDEYLDRPLDVATDHSIVDPGAVRHRLTRCRATGYAWTDQELDLEVNGLAAPIRDRSGAVVAAATLYGPSYRLSPRSRPGLDAEFARMVDQRAVALS